MQKNVEVSPLIRLNIFGYLPDAPKQASVVGKFSRFAVVRVNDGKTVFRGEAIGPVTNADTQEQVYIADFSALKIPGEYRLEVTGIGSSPPFRVAKDVYNFPFYTVMRGMYLWRCGVAVSGKHQGNTFAHEACHTEDAYLDFVGGGHVRRNAVGDWHDVGDYNKYVVNAGVTVGVMLSRAMSARRRKSWVFLKAHPEDHKSDTRGLNTGGYQTDDSDDRLWAVAELWQSTGDPALLKDLETRIRAQEARIDHDFDWANVRNLGMITYALSRRGGRDGALVAQVKANIVATADRIVQTAQAHGYARPLGNAYYWGCNGSVARQAVVLYAAYRVAKKPEYLHTILDALNHLFGRNYYGRSFVTGLGYQPPLHPHDRRSGGDKVSAPWPGYLVGGSHPAARNWRDEEADYRTNEIAINWNAALIYALAKFVSGG